MAYRFYKLLLWLYPAQFREEFGVNMARLFQDRCRREGLFPVLMETLPDLAITAWREHMDTLRRDILFSFRAMAKQPGFALAAFATLALGIGSTTAIFSVVKGVVLDPLPYREPKQLVELYEKRPKQGRSRNVVSAPDFMDWKKRNTVFEGMTAVSGGAFSISGNGNAELIHAALVSASFLQVLGVQPQLGRDFRADEEMPGKDQVVILNHGLWLRRFGGDPNIVGQKIMLSGKPFTVVGVLPDIEMSVRSQAEILQPLSLGPESSRAGHFLEVIARLKPGLTLDRARAEMDSIAAGLSKEYPNENTGHGVNVFPLDDEVRGNVRPALLILFSAVGLVLLVACANVANLYLARTSQRQREISVRVALGASPGRLVRQLLTESVLLGLLGGGAGVFLAHWGVRAFVAANPGNLPRLRSIQVDSDVLYFALAISVLTGILFGLVPAFHAAKTGLSGALKEGGRASTSGKASSRVRGLLVVKEVALALLLTIGAALMMQSFTRLASVNPGFDSNNSLSVTVALMGPKYPRPEDRTAFFSEFMDRIRPLPGVTSVGATTALPLAGGDSGSNFLIEGRPVPGYSQQPNARYRAVTPDYFQTMRIPVRAGRPITAHDTATAPAVLVINETMARQYWPDEDAVGKRITLSGEKIWREIAGVVGNVKHYRLDGETRPEMYFPYLQQPANTMTVVVRTALAPEGLEGAVRAALAEMDRDQPVAKMQTLSDVLTLSVAQPRLYSALLAGFSAMALLLAAVGIYGVMSFSVSQRVHEMGLRMALGASAGNVRGMVLKEGLMLAGAGVGLGLAGALILMRVLGKLLYGIQATDPGTFIGASLLLTGIAALACYLPALHATRADPMTALRSE